MVIIVEFIVCVFMLLCSYLVALTLQEEQEQSVERVQPRVPTTHLNSQPPTDQGLHSSQEWSE